MKRIALTGGFGTGKSTVGRMFEDLGIPRVDADILVHKLMESGGDVWREIVATFGEEILQSDREIDRSRLAEIVFGDAKKRKQLEAIVHPKVREAMHQEIDRLSQAGQTKIILEIPLLFEVGWDREEKWNAIIVVTCDEKIQQERASKKFGLSAEAIKARISAQLPLSEKIKKATFVIDNSNDATATRKEVEKIFCSL